MDRSPAGRKEGHSPTVPPPSVQVSGGSGCVPRSDGFSVRLHHPPTAGDHVPRLHQTALHWGRHTAGRQHITSLTQRDEAWQSVTQHESAKHSTMWHKHTRYDLTDWDAAWRYHSTMTWCGMVWCEVTRCNMMSRDRHYNITARGRDTDVNTWCSTADEKTSLLHLGRYVTWCDESVTTKFSFSSRGNVT